MKTLGKVLLILALSPFIAAAYLGVAVLVVVFLLLGAACKAEELMTDRTPN